jgi:hypothetical protein
MCVFTAQQVIFSSLEQSDFCSRNLYGRMPVTHVAAVSALPNVQFSVQCRKIYALCVLELCVLPCTVWLLLAAIFYGSVRLCTNSR